MAERLDVATAGYGEIGLCARESGVLVLYSLPLAARGLNLSQQFASNFPSPPSLLLPNALLVYRGQARKMKLPFEGLREVVSLTILD